MPVRTGGADSLIDAKREEVMDAIAGRPPLMVEQPPAQVSRFQMCQMALAGQSNTYMQQFAPRRPSSRWYVTRSAMSPDKDVPLHHLSIVVLFDCSYGALTSASKVLLSGHLAFRNVTPILLRLNPHP
jgi:hypothetical protein